MSEDLVFIVAGRLYLFEVCIRTFGVKQPGCQQCRENNKARTKFTKQRRPLIDVVQSQPTTKRCKYLFFQPRKNDWIRLDEGN